MLETLRFSHFFSELGTLSSYDIFPFNSLRFQYDFYHVLESLSFSRFFPLVETLSLREKILTGISLVLETLSFQFSPCLEKNAVTDNCNNSM